MNKGCGEEGWRASLTLGKVLVSTCSAEPSLGKKTLGGAFYDLLATAGGKPGPVHQ